MRVGASFGEFGRGAAVLVVGNSCVCVRVCVSVCQTLGVSVHVYVLPWVGVHLCVCVCVCVCVYVTLDVCAPQSVRLGVCTPCMFL